MLSSLVSGVESSYEKGWDGRDERKGPVVSFSPMTLHSSKRISTVDSRSYFKTARPLHLKSVLIWGRNVCPYFQEKTV